eukprot:5068836-Pleurochrysis_carterae.AAC.1
MAIEDINHMLSRFHPSSPSNNLAGSTCRLRWKVITVVRVPIVRSAWWPFKETESETNQPTEYRPVPTLDVCTYHAGPTALHLRLGVQAPAHRPRLVKPFAAVLQSGAGARAFEPASRSHDENTR